MNEKLAISIPTYNRPFILKENLTLMMPEIKRLDIPVYISDDSSNDDTYLIVSDLKKEYENIFYSKNEPALGHDKNCLKTLSIPNSDYIWYLGDSQIINDGGIKRILNIIESNSYDFLVVSSKNRYSNIPNKEYFECNEFFCELSWHATLTGVTIYRKDILFQSNYNKYFNSNFIQLGIILEEFIKNKNGLYWINEELIYPNKNKGESYWRDNIFKVFAEDWSTFILSLPSIYSQQNKIRVIKSHSINTRLFSLKSLILLRKSGILNRETYSKYNKSIKLASQVNTTLVFLISIMPILIISKTIKVVKLMSHKRSQSYNDVK